MFVTDVESPTDQGMIEVDRDVSVHWWKYERESTTITYVLHGGPEGHTEWMRRNANDLADVIGTIVFYDRRGCGESSRNIETVNIGYNQELNDLSKVVAHTHGDELIILMGHSFGSTIALQPNVSDYINVDGMVLSSPFIDPKFEQPFLDRTELGCTSMHTPTQNECDATVYSAWIDNEAYLERSYIQQLRNVESPILFVGGTCDWVFSSAAEQFVKSLDNTLSYRHKGGEHRAIFDDPEAFDSVFNEFINLAN